MDNEQSETTQDPDFFARHGAAMAANAAFLGFDSLVDYCDFIAELGNRFRTAQEEHKPLAILDFRDASRTKADFVTLTLPPGVTPLPIKETLAGLERMMIETEAHSDDLFRAISDLDPAPMRALPAPS